MTIHSTTWYELVCNGCGRHEDLGAGLDECANLPIPAGWRVGVDVGCQPHDYCPRCRNSIAVEDAAPLTPLDPASMGILACSPIEAGVTVAPSTLASASAGESVISPI